MAVNVRTIAAGTDATPNSVNNALNDLAGAIEDREDGTVALASPQITSFVNSLHDHEDNAGGGLLSLDALSSSGQATDLAVVTDGSGGFNYLALLAVPTGTILSFASTTIPAGYLVCDGQVVSRATYADLFAVIGDTFGAGNGSTTFGMPDLRGRTDIGMDNMGTSEGAADRVEDSDADDLGGSGGFETHTLTASELAEHTHPLAVQRTGEDALDRNVIDNWTSGDTTSTYSGPNTGGDAHNNMQPWMSLLKIIKT